MAQMPSFEVTNAAIVHKDRSGIAVREAVDAHPRN